MNQYLWQPLYEAAMFETQPCALESRITLAENALLDRLEDDLHARCVLDLKERLAIENDEGCFTFCGWHTQPKSWQRSKKGVSKLVERRRATATLDTVTDDAATIVAALGSECLNGTFESCRKHALFDRP